jgi:hypothetical protein
MRSKLIAALAANDLSRGATELLLLLPQCGRVGLVAVLAGLDGPVQTDQAVRVLKAAQLR